MFLATILQAGIAASLLASGAPQPSDSNWTDPSPHKLLRVPVSRSVALEVLDWGGQGSPLVFLAGGGNTAHIYDHFATRFIGRFHVFGITRRGFGGSSHPTTGYDTTTLVRDIVAVLDSLRIPRASFVAHSFGGSELNYLGARYPERVDRLVYLDSGFEYGALFGSPEWKNGLLYGAPQPPTPSYDDDTGTAWSWNLWVERLSGPGVPEAEVRAIFRFDATDRFLGSSSIDEWLKRLDRGNQPVDLTRIRAPVLALYAVPGSAEVMFPYWQTLDASARARCQKMFRALEGVHARLRRDFQDKIERVRVVTVPGSRHYIFLTNPAEVTHHMLEFLLWA